MLSARRSLKNSRRYHPGGSYGRDGAFWTFLLALLSSALHVRVCKIVGSDRLASVPLQDRDRPLLVPI